MVHPYLKRRSGKEPVTFPCPSPEHGPPDELEKILGRTLGVPIFQEQAMKIALDAAKFSPAEADRLRKAMATFRSRGMVHELEELMVGRMVARGYDPEFAQRCFNQIKGFGEYGFPESHAASFAHLVYVSSWLKCHYPAAFAAALLNSQPMGFYAPAQIVRDAAEHGVAVLPVDVNESAWDCTLERDFGARGGAEAQRDADEKSLCASAPLRAPYLKDRWRLDSGWALRLGLRQIDGLPEGVAAQLVAAREGSGRFADVASLRDRARLSPAQIERLAAADAFGSLDLPRRQALWDARTLVAAPELPLFAAARAREEGAEPSATRLPPMPLSEEVVADYQTQRLSLKAHPLSFLRASLDARGFIRAIDLRRRKHRTMVDIAGIVLIRQRPGSAKGVVFVTLEDETGVANLVIWPDTMERYRKVVMGARLMEVRGRVEYDDEVVHVIAARLADATPALLGLSDDLLPAELSRADHGSGFAPGPPDKDGGFAHRHPRDVRPIHKMLPPSRVYH
jgi:error-prone DNA polymerase